MADGYADQSPAIVAKEITLAGMEKLQVPAGRTAEGMGDLYGKFYKVVLKHVVEAIRDDKYD